MNKNYGKHIVVIELIKTHDAGILLANGGGVASTPTPAFFLNAQDRFKYHPAVS